MNLYTWGIHLNLASSRLLGSKREKQTMKTPWQKTLRRDTYFFNSCLLTVPEGGIGFLSSKFKCNEVSQSSRCTSLESTLKLKSSRSRWSLSVWSLQVQIKARRLCQLFIKPLTSSSLSHYLHLNVNLELIIEGGNTVSGKRVCWNSEQEACLSCKQQIGKRK